MDVKLDREGFCDWLVAFSVKGPFDNFNIIIWANSKQERNFKTEFLILTPSSDMHLPYVLV